MTVNSSTIPVQLDERRVNGSNRTVRDLLEARAAAYPDTVAFTFISEGRSGDLDYTYADLHRRARALAGSLQQSCARGERALLLLPSGPDYVVAFFGCIYAGVIAVPLFPPKPGRDNSRIESVALDADACLILGQSQKPSGAGGKRSTTTSLESLPWIGVNCDENGEAAFVRPELDANETAYLQYTSGSTRSPKGVVVTNRNLLHNLADLSAGWDHDPGSRLLTWLPPFHDMGLIYGILAPVCSGFRCYMMPPAAFLQRPARWLEALSRYSITHTIAPNFAYEICNQKLDFAQCAGLDLRSVKVAVNGAEPVRHSTMVRFAAKFGPYGFNSSAFCPGYGLAEATLKVCAVNASEKYRTLWVNKAALAANHVVAVDRPRDGDIALVGCGRPRLGTSVRIVHAQTMVECGPRQIGEIWVTGDTVTTGYWRNREETERVFGAQVVGIAGIDFLRTGDLGFIDEGEVFITGRLKDLIVVAGRNYYPSDIESSAQECDPACRAACGAAFSIETEDGSQEIVLVQEIEVVQEIDSTADLRCERLAGKIRAAVAQEHGLELTGIEFIEPRSLPKTTSGKIQRTQAREQYLARTLRSVWQWRSETDSGPICESVPFSLDSARPWLAALVSKTLGIPESNISSSLPLSCQGLTSLGALNICHSIEKNSGVTLSISFLLSDAVLDDIVLRLQQEAAAGELKHPATPPLAHGECPITPGQRALLLLEELTNVPGVYNITCALRINGEIDLARLEFAVEAIEKRHPILTATFASPDASLARMNSRRAIAISTAEGANDTGGQIDSWIAQQAHARFRLDTGPLARVSLLRLRQSEWIFTFTIHHAIADLWSIGILLYELFEIYDNPRTSLPEPEMPFADYAAAALARLNGPEGERLAAYWDEVLRGQLPMLGLYADRPRPAEQTYRGSAVDFRLDAQVLKRIREFAKATGATIPIVLLAAYEMLLCRYGGQEEVVVGTPYLGRQAAGARNTVGYLVNPLPIRFRYNPAMTFREVVAQQRATVLGAYERQDFPFASMAERHTNGRDASRSPIFQALFTFQQTDQPWASALAPAAAGATGQKIQAGKLQLETIDVPVQTAQFELALNLAQTGRELAGRMVYNTDLYDRPTVERLCSHFKNLIESFVDNADSPVPTVSMLSAEERKQIVEQWNRTDRNYDFSRPLHHLIEEQARRTPDALAAACEARELSYAELDRLSNQLARRLVQTGIQPESLVGLCMDRSLELVIALVAILKAGGAYLPLDPGYPDERLLDMIETAAPSVILTAPQFVGRLSGVGAQLIALNEFCPEVRNESSRPLEVSVLPDNPAYAIFTSGSTGRPKGAVNTHRGIVNRLLWMQETYALTPEDRVLQKTPFSFDVSVWEFFWPLISGAAIILARPGGHKDPKYLADCIREHQVTVLHFVPSMLAAFLDEETAGECNSIRLVIASGEALTLDLQGRFLRTFRAELHNLYGPTEASVDVTSWECSRDKTLRSVPIGQPIANTQIYILDKSLEPAPPGVPGELHIAGIGLARGYVNRPDLTADRFVPNPFDAEPGARMYRTGDLAQYRADGVIEYLGRADRQVKIRGCRIELSEIESIAASYPAVIQAVAVSQSAVHGPVIVLYAVPAPGTIISEADLRDFLKRQLPDYMLPAGILFLSEFPKLPNGKADRKALPEWRPDTSASNSAAPLTPAERMVADVWRDLLKIENLRPSDNFFELGGHSLLLTQVASRIRELAGVDLPLAAFFQDPTVSRLAAAIDDAIHGPEPDRRDHAGVSGCVLTSPTPQNRKFDAAHGGRTCTIAIPTANRPDQLLRCIQSWIANAALSDRGVEVAVFDDSSPETQAITRQRLGQLARESGVRISYAGSRERLQYVETLVEEAEIPRESAMFALFGNTSGLPHTGANRNAALLHCQGQRFLSVDDDTLCRMAPAPGQRRGIRQANGYSHAILPLDNRDELSKHLFWSDRNPLDVLDAVLGRTAEELGLDSPGLVRVASFGAAGDCGWGSPTNFLFVEETSFAALCASPESYQAGCLSREMIQAVAELTLTSEPEHLMTMFTGFDGTALLPPFLPVGRGQDAIFGTTLSVTAGTAAPSLVASLPWVLAHVPDGQRSFWPGEVVRGASGIGLSTLISLALKGSSEEGNGASSESAFERVGRQMRAIGGLTDSEFKNYLAAVGRQYRTHVESVVQNRISRYGEANPLWRRDGERFLSVLRESEASNACGLPLDLLFGRDEGTALRLTREIFRSFGDLLCCWPAIAQAANTLRVHSVTPAQPVV